MLILVEKIGNSNKGTMNKYRILKLTHKSGEIDYTVSKIRNHWFTGLPEEVYLKDCDTFWGWTRNINRAERFAYREGAMSALRLILRSEGRKVVKVETEGEYNSI